MKQFEVVISGVSGRFADCDDVDSFKKKLYDGENFISFDDRKWKSSISYECTSHKSKRNEYLFSDLLFKLTNFTRSWQKITSQRIG